MAQPLDGILETAIYAADLDAAEAFYGGVLGLEKVTRQANRHLFYRCGPGILLIFNPAETAKPVPAGALPVPSHGATGPGHVCFRVRGEQMDGIVARLQAAGVPVESDFCWSNGARSIYFRDPAGNSLECAEPRLWNLE
ncbi:glyoxalase/bleomycin resistance/extradiol dioxygenase family protein [Rhizobium sp. KAs_5_22]|uniref:VOC family protein n=1 Tax=Ciceribacter selenitireducens TaxID=448181 RepID=UPI00048A7C3F|nr:VOC family protein [Ciceribacter selenitireducens]PPJ48045.1 glyoxalase/bleomycin resistance/extradiol dioxygenase family protein [Rhizobium sp. KAs_5_22]